MGFIRTLQKKVGKGSVKPRCDAPASRDACSPWRRTVDFVHVAMLGRSCLHGEVKMAVEANGDKTLSCQDRDVLILT